MNTLRNLLELIFPRSCPCCGDALVRGEKEICLDCLTDIEQTEFHHNSQENEFFYRLAGRVPLEGAAALFYFDKKGKLQSAVSALKYNRAAGIGGFLGEYYGRRLSGSPILDGVEALLPVPLHRQRQRERGYNQAALIASGIGKACGIPVKKDILSRRQATQSQTRKGRTGRWENVRDAFVAQAPVPGRIALVDDVVTTGATTEACIRSLLAARPDVKVIVLCLAVTRGQS